MIVRFFANWGSAAAAVNAADWLLPVGADMSARVVLWAIVCAACVVLQLRFWRWRDERVRCALLVHEDLAMALLVSHEDENPRMRELARERLEACRERIAARMWW